MIFDNAKEDSEHWIIIDASINAYFANLNRSNQRAKNENTNGLIRQLCQRSTSFEHALNENIQQIKSALNNRPRKSLV